MCRRKIPKDQQPFSVAGDTGLSHLIKALNPHSSQTSRTFWTTEVIPEGYERTCKSVKDELPNISILVLLVSYFQTGSSQFLCWGLQCAKI